MKSWSALWLFFCLLSSVIAAYHAYSDPYKFFGVVELLTLIISILTGISLAVIAVLSSPFVASRNISKDPEALQRIDKIVKNEEEIYSSGQIIFFWLFFTGLALALLFTWSASGKNVDFDSVFLKTLAGTTAAVGVFAFLWSARLPLMLQRISRQRRDLS